MPVSKIFIILPMLKGKKTTDTEYLSFQLSVGFIACTLLSGAGAMSVLNYLFNIFYLLLHNFNVLGVNTAIINNTILYFMGFKPLLGGVFIVIHVWVILGF